MLVGSGNVGACRGVELSLLLFVLGCKFIELKLYKQKKLKIKIHIFEKNVKNNVYSVCSSSSLRFFASCIALLVPNSFRFAPALCWWCTGWKRGECQYIRSIPFVISNYIITLFSIEKQFFQNNIVIKIY